MGPTRGPPGSCRPQMGPMLAPWTLLSGYLTIYCIVGILLFVATPSHWGYLPSHDDVIKWKHFPRHWPFVRGIHWSPVNYTHKGQGRGALMFSSICHLNKRLSKQSWGWWCEMPSRSLWHRYNVHLKCSKTFSDSVCFILPTAHNTDMGPHFTKDFSTVNNIKFDAKLVTQIEGIISLLQC